MLRKKEKVLSSLEAARFVRRGGWAEVQAAALWREMTSAWEFSYRVGRGSSLSIVTTKYKMSLRGTRSLGPQSTTV